MFLFHFLLLEPTAYRPLKAYAMERQQACANSFAMVLDDLDICQLLPLRGDQYEQGVRGSLGFVCPFWLTLG